MLLRYYESPCPASQSGNVEAGGGGGVCILIQNKAESEVARGYHEVQKVIFNPTLIVKPYLIYF